MKNSKAISIVLTGAVALSCFAGYTGMSTDVPMSSGYAVAADETGEQSFISTGFSAVNATIYDGTDPEKFMMINGRKYYQGIAMKHDTSEYSSISFNVEEVSTVSFSVGHIDNRGGNNGQLGVYVDNELVETIDLSIYDPIRTYSFDVSDASIIRFQLGKSYWQYFGIVDVTADSEKVPMEYVVPEYSSNEDFVHSGFSAVNATIYDGTDPEKFMQVNGKKYYKGVAMEHETSEYSFISFNVEEVKTVSFSVGHIDNKGGNNGQLKVYVDNELVETIDLSINDPTRKYSFDVSDASIICFQLGKSYWQYFGIVNVDIEKGSSVATTPATTVTTTTTTTTTTDTTTTTATTTATTTTKTATTTAATTTVAKETTADTTKPTEPAPVVPGELALGDVNGDNVIDLADAKLIIDHYADMSVGGTGILTDEQLKAGDVFDDGMVDAYDASFVVDYYTQRLSGKEISLEEFMGLEGGKVLKYNSPDNGFTADEIDSSEIKPELSFESEVVGDFATVSVVLENGQNGPSNIGLCISYDERLTPVTDNPGELSYICGNSYEIINSSVLDSENHRIVISSVSNIAFEDGKVFTFSFRLPENRKDGDKYSLEFEKTDGSMFTDSKNSSTGKLMQAYVFENGLENGYIQTGDGQPAGEIIYGDVNLDGTVTIADAVAILQYLANSDEYGLNEYALINADVDEKGNGVNTDDALLIQKFDAKLVSIL